MTEINRVLRQAAWRLFVLDLFRTLCVAGTVALAGLILLRIADAFFAIVNSWPQVFGAAAVLTLLAAGAWSLIRRSRGVDVARELDERADLRESLSTALCVGGSSDPWAKVVVETARQRARGVKVRQAIPYEAPRLAPAPFAAALALLVVWFSMPAHVQWSSARAQEQEEQAQLVEARQEFEQAKKTMEELARQARIDLDPDEADDADLQNPERMNPEQLRREAVRRLTDFRDRLQELQNNEQAKAHDATKQMMRNLRQPGDGPLNEFAQSLQRGDFAKARDDLSELMNELANDEMSAEDREQLQKQLQNLAEQLQKLAENTQELERQLQQAGMDAQQAQDLARNPEALQEALEKMEGLSEEQKRQLMDAAQAQQGACEAAAGMAGAMSQLCEGMGESGLSQAGMDGMEGLAGQLSALEMMQAEMANLEAALGQCEGQLAGLGQGLSGGGMCEATGIGLWREGASDSFGAGSGGPGKGDGAPSPEGEDAPFTTRKEKESVEQRGGPVIGRTLVYGEAIRGESTAEVWEAVTLADQNARDYIEQMQVPPEFHNAVKGYFGRTKRRLEQGEEPAQRPEDAPDR